MSNKDNEGQTYPINTYDPPGSDAAHPDNSRFMMGDKYITSGPANDPQPEADRFVSGGQLNGPHVSGVLDKNGNVIDTKRRK